MILAASAALLVCGCKLNSSETTIDKVEVLSGSSDQCAFTEQKFSKPVQIGLLGPARGLMPGSKGERKPVPDAAVSVQVRPGSDLTVDRTELKSDSGGHIHFSVTAGKKIGDHYVDVIPMDAPEKKTSIRFITGMKIEGARQEPSAESFGEEPIRVILKDADKPLENVPVYFSVASTPSDDKYAKVRKSEVLTDENGVAETEFQVGKATGVYRYSVEVSDPEKALSIRKV